ncbi:FAD-binding oxidoreductase [Actinomadura madurae]|uniref:FAD-binding oxidoreductase n=1 Tax=Actinomadura madurae TaxID=1993 RepID=UPI0020D2355C|nr:FAD-binding oxidoreductase [Actinomadura madurae]MCQ0006647.1 FAD-binding oxidoreductase [Actinomadura madurae]MCQ0018054.1 FAD-binding oxidoreductase [Actinomadura madurae]
MASMVPAEALTTLSETLDSSGLLLPPLDLSRYEIAPNNLRGRAGAVIRPRTVEEVRAVLGVCREHRLRVVPQGANSGLVGSGLPDPTGTQAVLSTDRMRGRFEVDEDGRTLTASAGWTLDEINARLAPARLHLPIEVGSSPSVGGMVATNTAGSNVLRHGDVRRRLLGVQAVIADGGLTVIDTLAPLRKRNEGLDATQLFVGTEGAYGVVTAASFELAPLPASRAAAWLQIPDPAGLSAVLREFEHRAGEWLSAFELASATAVHLLDDRYPHLLTRVPAGDHDSVLVEIGAADGSAEEVLLAAIDALCDRGDVGDAVVGAPDRLWEVRHTIPAITERMDPVAAFDISAPRGGLTALRAELGTRLARHHPGITPIELGHYGDGGLHLILPLPSDIAADQDGLRELRNLVFDTVVRDFGGSFSAEHGVGPKNADVYARYVPAPIQRIAECLKRELDPAGVLGWRTP